MRLDVGVVPEEKIADLPAAEMPSRMTRWAQEQWRELVFDKLRVFRNVPV